MQNPNEELKQYRNQIFKDVVFLLDTRYKLLKEFTDTKNSIIWEGSIGGISSVLYDSLFDNLVITLSWLYSNSKSDKRSLSWYLQQVKANTEQFSDKEVDAQLRKVDGVADIVERLSIVRSKWIAHRDPVAFNDPKQFLKNNGVSLKDFETLIEIAKDIINEHFGRFEDTEVLFDLPIVGIEGLVSGEKARQDVLRFKEEIDLSKDKVDFEERKNKAIELLLNR